MTGNESIKDSEGAEVVQWMVSRKEKENEEVHTTDATLSTADETTAIKTTEVPAIHTEAKTIPTESPSKVVTVVLPVRVKPATPAVLLCPMVRMLS